MSSPSSPDLSLDAAKEALAKGELILFPTETFFALGCDAMNPDAVGRVFSLKQRSLDMPLPVVIGSRDQLPLLVTSLSDYALSLMDAFWPGPLSIVLRAQPEVPDLLTANAQRIAVRFSPHPAVLQLYEATGSVLVASSANFSGAPPAATAEAIDPSLVRGPAGIFLAGPPPNGELPSTVIDIRERRGQSGVRILRPGAITAEMLQNAGFHVWDEMPVT